MEKLSQLPVHHRDPQFAGHVLISTADREEERRLTVRLCSEANTSATVRPN